MRFYLPVFFCVSVFFMSCGEDRHQTPKGIIPEHAMAELLTDIHIVDGSLSAYPNPDSLAKHGMGFYLAVFKFHHTDSATFRKSLKFYSTRPDLLSEIYTGINNRLQKKADSLVKIQPKVNQDSINKVNESKAKEKTKATADSLKKMIAKAKADSAANKHKPLRKQHFIFKGNRNLRPYAVPRQ